MADAQELHDRMNTAEARAREAMEKVTQAALFHASDKFITDPADPGWGAELHENMLEDAIVEAAAEINLWKTAKKEFKNGGRE